MANARVNQSAIIVGVTSTPNAKVNQSALIIAVIAGPPLPPVTPSINYTPITQTPPFATHAAKMTTAGKMIGRLPRR